MDIEYEIYMIYADYRYEAEFHNARAMEFSQWRRNEAGKRVIEKFYADAEPASATSEVEVVHAELYKDWSIAYYSNGFIQVEQVVASRDEAITLIDSISQPPASQPVADDAGGGA